MIALLKDMNMPESCDVCRLFNDDRYACTYTMERYHWNSKGIMNNCPLIWLEDNRLFGIRDGVVYVANVTIPNSGKTINLPPMIEFQEDDSNG